MSSRASSAGQVVPLVSLMMLRSDFSRYGQRGYEVLPGAVAPGFQGYATAMTFGFTVHTIVAVLGATLRSPFYTIGAPCLNLAAIFIGISLMILCIPPGKQRVVWALCIMVNICLAVYYLCLPIDWHAALRAAASNILFVGLQIVSLFIRRQCLLRHGAPFSGAPSSSSGSGSSSGLASKVQIVDLPPWRRPGGSAYGSSGSDETAGSLAGHY